MIAVLSLHKTIPKIYEERLAKNIQSCYNICMQSLLYFISKGVKGADAFYTLNWSPLYKAEKYTVTTGAPSVSGIYELYKMGENRELCFLESAIAWYGGIRSNVRAAIDEDATQDPERKKILADAELYFRFSCCEIFADLQDVLWFMRLIYFPDETPPDDSGRYENIYLEENSPDNFIWNANAT